MISTDEADANCENWIAPTGMKNHMEAGNMKMENRIMKKAESVRVNQPNPSTKMINQPNMKTRSAMPNRIAERHGVLDNIFIYLHRTLTLRFRLVFKAIISGGWLSLPRIDNQKPRLFCHSPRFRPPTATLMHACMNTTWDSTNDPASTGRAYNSFPNPYENRCRDWLPQLGYLTELLRR